SVDRSRVQYLLNLYLNEHSSQEQVVDVFRSMGDVPFTVLSGIIKNKAQSMDHREKAYRILKLLYPEKAGPVPSGLYEDSLRALKDKDPQIRGIAVKVLERYLGLDPAILSAFIERLENDPDQEIRLMISYNLVIGTVRPDLAPYETRIRKIAESE